MHIQNTAESFFELFKEVDSLSLQDLDTYYAQYPDIFKEYFQYHCPKTEERLTAAIERYSPQMEELKLVANRLPSIVETVMGRFEALFGTKLELNFHIFVGGYGSNAFVERKIIGDVYFAIEKLSSDPVHLEVIVAHEIGHIYHNYLSDQVGIKWSEVDWEHGVTSLYREGIATYLSMLTANSGQKESICFSYNDEGDEWLQFCKENHRKIAKRFLEDAGQWSFDKEREWFRLSGGSYFGFNRLGYYLGTCFVQDYVKQHDKEAIITLWARESLDPVVREWLKEQII